MKKNLKSVVYSGIMVMAISSALNISHAEEKVVNIYNWSDYIEPSVLESFTKETGIKIVYSVYDNNSLLETKLLAGGSGFDVVVPSADFLSRQIKANIFQKLDKSKLPNLVNMDKDLEKKLRQYDPDNAYSINYMWGTVGFGINTDKVKSVLGDDAPMNSLSLAFDPKYASKLASCGYYMMDAPDIMIPTALAYLGLDPLSTKKDDVEKAEAALLKVRPYIRKFDSSEYISNLANGDICFAIGYSGDILQASDRAVEAKNGVNVTYTIPKEGAQLWFDQMAIPADAPHTENALVFLNFMMKPEMIAKSSNFISYANGNIASKKFINKDILENQGVYPNMETMSHLFANDPLSSKSQRLFNKVWTKIKTSE